MLYRGLEEGAKALTIYFRFGCIGLIKAIDNFDTTLNVQFSTYAVPMIIRGG